MLLSRMWPQLCVGCAGVVTEFSGGHQGLDQQFSTVFVSRHINAEILWHTGNTFFADLTRKGVIWIDSHRTAVVLAVVLCV